MGLGFGRIKQWWLWSRYELPEKRQVGAASFSIQSGLCQKSCAVPGTHSFRKAGSIGVGLAHSLKLCVLASSMTNWLWQDLTDSLIHVLIWKGRRVRTGDTEVPSPHNSQLSCREEQISSSFLAILNTECSSQTLVAFVLNVVHFTLLVGFQSSERSSGLSLTGLPRYCRHFVQCSRKDYE